MFCMAMCAMGFVVIFCSTNTTATGTKRLSVPCSEMASNTVTSMATSNADNTQTPRGRSVSSSSGRCTARKAMMKKTTEPSTLLYSSSTS